jgi:carbamoyl-phosphate synthase large subunit
MNLLITNTRNPEAYALIRALRPYADRIAVTMEGTNPVAARLSHAASSRLVDKRYHVPSPVKDWQVGRIQKENTKREEDYIQAVQRICDQEKIDTIFPSSDPHVYVFSKNKERFKELGILIPILDYEAVIAPLDKYRAIQIAKEVGFPCPKTYLPESEEDIRGIADELGFPLIIKRRFAATGQGLQLIKDLPELLGKAYLDRARRDLPMIQEFIPGGVVDNFAITLDRTGIVKMLFCRKTLCHLGRFCQIFVVDSPISHAYATDAARMIQKLGWWGSITVQTRIDSRDNTPKLMGINPRIGGGLWHRIQAGINEPLMILKIARGEEVEPIREYPVGMIFVDPVEDIVKLNLALVDLLIYRFRIGFLGKSPIDRSNRAMSLKELVRSVRQTYFSGGPRASNLYTKYFFQDPLVSMIWWLQYIIRWWIQIRPKDLGR